jgi:hypothetical protein
MILDPAGEGPKPAPDQKLSVADVVVDSHFNLSFELTQVSP